MLEKREADKTLLLNGSSDESVRSQANTTKEDDNAEQLLAKSCELTRWSYSMGDMACEKNRKIMTKLDHHLQHHATKHADRSSWETWRAMTIHAKTRAVQLVGPVCKHLVGVVLTQNLNHAWR